MEGSSGNGNNFQDSSSMNNLLCQEDTSCLNVDDEDEHTVGPQLLNSQLVPYYHDDSVNVDDGHIQMLVQRERNSPLNPFVSASDYPSWLKDTRILAIDWILITHKSFGFQNHTAYLSVIYLDRFISRRLISEDQSWAVSLLSVACLSLAAKMDESIRVPALSEYQVENYTFGSNLILEMELMVLITLDWRMGLITPFDYINYFIKELGDLDPNQDELISRITELIMALITESDSVEDYRPFVVAAAAVMAASDWQLTQEMLTTRISTVALWGTSNNLQRQQEEEQLIACYTLMQRLCSEDNPCTPNVPEVDYTASPPSLAGTKRSLSFRDSNQKPDLPD